MLPDPDKSFFSPAGLSQDLRRRSVRGAGITVVSQLAKFTLRFGSTAVLARLLTPADYGLIAMASVVTNFAALFKDSGLTAATLQRQDLEHGQVSTLFWINVGLGCLIAVLLAAGAPLVAMLFREPRLTGITSLLALSFVFSGLTVQHQALLRRQLRFKAVAAVDLVSLIVGIATAILMAVEGFGYWALVGLAVGTAAAHCIGVWIVLPWRPGPPRRKSGVRPMLRLGSDVLNFNVVNYFSRQADNLLIGWYWGAGPLGFYEKAYSLLLLPINQINGPVAAVAVPTLSRTAADPERFRRYFLSCFQMVAGCTVPVVLAIALFADEIVALWLGPRWQSTATLFRYLSIAAVFSALTNPIGWMLISAGETRRYRYIGLLIAPIVCGAFAIALPYGAGGVALSYSAVMLVTFLPVWRWAVRGTPIRLRDILSELAGPFCAGAAAAMLAWVAMRMPGIESDALRTILGALVFGGTYAFVLLRLFRKWHFFGSILRTLIDPLPRAAGIP